MRRWCVCTLAVVLGTVALFDVRPAAAAVTLPDGFTTVTYPTGQKPYDLTDFAWLGDGDLLTIAKEGQITFVPHGGSPRVVAQVPDVRAVDDHGLLGLALANDYATTGHLFLSYDKGDPKGTGVGMLEEWQATPAADPTSVTKVRTVVDGSATSPQLTQVATTHGIDTVLVAPDDTLYWSVGDNSGNDGDPQTLRAQDIDQPYGKLMHVTVAGNGVTTNPFYRAAAPSSWRSRVYAYGLRNPFRLTFDPRSGLPVVGDVGWNTNEEVDVLHPGANAGWPCYEGDDQTTFSSYATCQTLYAAGTAVPPVWSYPHAGQGAAVTAGAFYTGSSYPAKYHDSLFLADYTRGVIWTLATDGDQKLTRAPETDGFATDAGGPVAFQTGPDGDISYADIASSEIRRLVYTPGNRAPVAQLSATSDAGSRTIGFSGSGSYDLDGDALTYAWTFGDGGTATGEKVSHTYADDDPAQVSLTVTDPLGAHDTATQTVHPGNHAPVISLTTPPAGRRYGVGDPVSLSATATDAEDGPLTISWDTALVHCPFAGSCHLHPDGTTTGPTYRKGFTDHGADTTMRITVSATDSLGATSSKTYVALPDLHTLTVASPVPVTVNGARAVTTPVVAKAVVQLDAPLTSGSFRFSGWSDHGAAKHTFLMPAKDLRLTATYTTPIDQRYAALGGASSFLGAPAGVEHDLPGGRERTYAHGQILWSAVTGAHEVHGRLAAKFSAGGGAAAFGFPTTDEIGVRGGRASYFTGARLYYSGGTGAHFSRGPLLAKYLAAGGPGGYGLPKTDDTATTGGYFATFTGGRSIYYSEHGAHLVYGKIRSRYASMGAERSCLGFPTSDEYAVTGGRRNTFEHGQITYLRSTKRATSSC